MEFRVDDWQRMVAIHPFQSKVRQAQILYTNCPPCMTETDTSDLNKFKTVHPLLIKSSLSTSYVEDVHHKDEPQQEAVRVHIASAWRLLHVNNLCRSDKRLHYNINQWPKHFKIGQIKKLILNSPPYLELHHNFVEFKLIRSVKRAILQTYSQQWLRQKSNRNNVRRVVS